MPALSVFAALLACGTLFTSCRKVNSNKISAELEGFGAATSGGAGRTVVHVTSLDASGPGSLHDAIGNDRIIVFDVSGTIDHFRWDSSIEFPVSNLTIDGTTAPSSGVHPRQRGQRQLPVIPVRLSRYHC